MTFIITRRTLVGGLAGTLALPAFASPVPTSDQELGPFYPVARPLDQDADLTRVRGAKGVAKGEAIDVFGQVLDHQGKPVPRARLDIWQANAVGRYMHPGDDRADAPIDPNFQGSAVVMADDNGRYRFRTIKPGTYPIGDGMVRTRHIHVDVTGRSNRLTTQMYFTGEPLNDTDILFPQARPKESVLATPVGPAGWQWDIVLLVG